MDAMSTSSSNSSDDDERDNHIRIKDYVETIVLNYAVDDFKSHFRMDRTSISTLIERYDPNVSLKQGGWPRVTSTKAVFEKKKNISNVIGAIDGTHFRINRPKVHPEDYCNRKGYHSIIMQGVVNSKMVFIDIYVGEPGSMHDARVFRRSALYKTATENPADLFYGKYKLIGDSAYPALDWLSTPKKDNGHLSNDDKDFNYRHSSTRIVVENAYGHLKGRFRRLQKFDNLTTIFIINCIGASCVLHNICQMRKDFNDDIFMETV
ncbi:hypothetical protein PPYR_00748 [Photinus pyralis]|uniref:DDE Tnp4 domain-containing protein n=1 Tax=Photinus pyralis TaxID=7054 RepID=A0A5N4B2M8_PHOPY|nr:hypothetical protein PPYR_00748 [Photinus pyralis]